MAPLVQDGPGPSLLQLQVPPAPEGRLHSSPSAPSEWTLPSAGRVTAPNRPLRWPKGPLTMPQRWQRQAQRWEWSFADSPWALGGRAPPSCADNYSLVIIPKLPGPAVAEAQHRPSFLQGALGSSSLQGHPRASRRPDPHPHQENRAELRQAGVSTHISMPPTPQSGS